MGQVYIEHFSEPLAHARHYVGFVQSNHPGAAFKRHQQHLLGQGANLVKVVMQKGIRVSLVRVIPNQCRADERRIKNRKNTAQLCPVCRMERAAGKQLKITFTALSRGCPAAA